MTLKSENDYVVMLKIEVMRKMNAEDPICRKFVRCFVYIYMKSTYTYVPLKDSLKDPKVYLFQLILNIAEHAVKKTIEEKKKQWIDGKKRMWGRMRNEEVMSVRRCRLSIIHISCMYVCLHRCQCMSVYVNIALESN